MPGSGVHYGLRIFSTDSLIEEIKPGTGDSCALCLDSIQEEGGEKVNSLNFCSKLTETWLKLTNPFQPGDLKGGNCIEQSEEGSHKIRSWFNEIATSFKVKHSFQRLVGGYYKTWMGAVQLWWGVNYITRPIFSVILILILSVTLPILIQIQILLLLKLIIVRFY